MRILELGKFYPPERGGMETLLKIWAEGFAAEGDEVQCVVSNRQFKTVVETLSGVKIKRQASAGIALSTSLCPTYPFAARRWRPDLIHAHAPNPLADLAILAAARDIPVVISWHSDVIRQKLAMRLYGPLQRAVLKRASVVVVATENHHKFSSALQGYSEKVQVIPFGLDLSRFAASPSNQSAAAQWRSRAEADFIFLNLGRLVGYKGQRYAIEALVRVPKAELWIAGTGPLGEQLKVIALEFGVSGRVRFLGDISDDELPGLLHACDAFVFPSISPNEAFGLVLVEAMACGKPIIACDLESGVPCVCRDGVNGLIVPPEDPMALAGAMNSLVNSVTLRATLSNNGLFLAKTDFSKDGMIQHYRALFAKCLSDGKI